MRTLLHQKLLGKNPRPLWGKIYSNRLDKAGPTELAKLPKSTQCKMPESQGAIAKALLSRIHSLRAAVVMRSQSPRGRDPFSEPVSLSSLLSSLSSSIIYHLSFIIYHLSFIIYHLSSVIFHLSSIIINSIINSIIIKILVHIVVLFHSFLLFF